MKICRLVDGQPTDIKELPGAYSNISTGGRYLPEMAKDGWRIYSPDLSTGADIKTSHWEDTGKHAVQVVDAVWTAAERAQQAADAKAAEDKAAAEQAACDAEAKAAWDRAVAGVDGSVEERLTNLETVVGLRQAK